MGQKEVDALRDLIIKRAKLLKKVKTAKGKALVSTQNELREVQRRISALDEKQH